jgi:hypothetical protein
LRKLATLNCLLVAAALALGAPATAQELEDTKVSTGDVRVLSPRSGNGCDPSIEPIDVDAEDCAEEAWYLAWTIIQDGPCAGPVVCPDVVKPYACLALGQHCGPRNWLS